MYQLTHQLVLGSKSPRRQELLKGMGFDFELRTKETAEDYPSDLPCDEVAGYLANIKADALLPTLSSNELLVTSDTVVIIDNQVLGKPNNSEEALHMLAQLSGKTHRVITGVHLATLQLRATFSVTTEVSFYPMDVKEMQHYISNYQPFDKAGSYGIQEWIGFIGIEKMNGSYYNVMGLPTAELWQKLKAFGFIQLR
jgi:septum formation protein